MFSLRTFPVCRDLVSETAVVEPVTTVMPKVGEGATTKLQQNKTHRTSLP